MKYILLISLLISGVVGKASDTPKDDGKKHIKPSKTLQPTKKNVKKRSGNLYTTIESDDILEEVTPKITKLLPEPLHKLQPIEQSEKPESSKFENTFNDASAETSPFTISFSDGMVSIVPKPNYSPEQSQKPAQAKETHLSNEKDPLDLTYTIEHDKNYLKRNINTFAHNIDMIMGQKLDQSGYGKHIEAQRALIRPLIPALSQAVADNTLSQFIDERSPAETSVLLFIFQLPIR